MSKSHLRIAMFSDSSLPILNGVSVSVDSLIRELRRQGHSVHFFTAAHPGYKERDPNTYRTHSIITPIAKNYPLAFPPFIKMLHEFRQHEFDIVHTHTPFIVGFVGLRWAESHELPIVSTYHTLYDRYAYYLPFVPRRYVRYKIAKHTNYYYRRVARVICPSQFAQKWLRRHAVKTPSVIIPTGGLERQMLNRSECRARLGIAPHERVMLCVGRMAREKNLETLFAMAKEVFRQDENARLWLVGDGPHFEALRICARDMEIGNRVKFVGFVDREAVDQYYAAADVFVFASITETQGLVVQEAMLYGLPTVCVLGGGASEGIVNGENGYLVRNDAVSFADQVLELLSDDRLYARISSKAFESVKDKTTSAMAEQVVATYEDVLRGQTAAPVAEPIRLL